MTPFDLVNQHSENKLCIRKNESMFKRCPKYVGFVRNMSEKIGQLVVQIVPYL